MLKRYLSGIIPLGACVMFAGSLACAVYTAPALSTRGEVSDATPTTKANRLAPGPNDGRIAFATAWLLRNKHFLMRPLDDEYAGKFLDRYCEELDPRHWIFTQADMAAFAPYRTNLDNLTYTRRGEADTTPAYIIFARFLERFEQHVAYVTNLLQHEKFEFKNDERLEISRRDEPYPRDLDEAKQLWRQRLRYEYMLEKLDRAAAAKTATATSNAPKSQAKTVTGTTPAPKKKSDAEDIIEKLTKRYNNNLHFYRELESDDVLERYLSALTHIYDPHSDYMNSGGAANFAIGMNLALFGIGAELTSEDGYCTITKLQPGPAEKSKKLKPKDRIIAVAQSNAPPVDVVDMSINKVVQFIRGPKGTEVRLTIIPADEPTERRIVSLIRDEIKLTDQEAKAKIIETSDGAGGTTRMGVIDLPSFYATMDLSGRKPTDPPTDRPTVRSTTADVARLLKKLKEEKVSGVILDLRHNGGGSLEEATALASLFIKGPVVQVRAPRQQPAALEDPDSKVQYTGPLIVLTSRGSASAAEIVAGALQDYGRALIVGDISTFGKGTVQNLNPLRAFIEPSASTPDFDPGNVKVTIRKYYRPSGTSTLFKGVLPDIVLPSPANYSEDIGEAALDEMFGNHYSKLENTSTGNTLGRDTIESVPFDKHDLVQSSLAELLKKSSARVATNQDFAYVREDIELFRKQQADKTVSLNEAKAIKDREDAEARAKARNAERKTRKPVEQKTYEVKLKDVDLPGLPPAMTRVDAGSLKGMTITHTSSPLQLDTTPGTPRESGYINWKTPKQAPGFVVEYDKNFIHYFGSNGVAAIEAAIKSSPATAATSNSVVYIFDKDFTDKFNTDPMVRSNAFAALAAAVAKDEPAPIADVTLEEAENILADYIKLFAQKNLLSSKDHPNPNPAVSPAN